MRNMFLRATAFNNGDVPFTGTFLNQISNVTNMRGMFYEAPAFNQDISGWNINSLIVNPPTDFSTAVTADFWISSGFIKPVPIRAGFAYFRGASPPESGPPAGGAWPAPFN